jgi:threonine aldolase
MEPHLWADFRSDACTAPSHAMRAAMAKAEVGNDDFGEDPTIRRLEERVAGLLGKPASLFVQSGTMANLVALLCHLDCGDRLVTSPNFHIFYWEGDAVHRIVQADFDLASDDTQGRFTTVKPPSEVDARSRLLSLENPVNRLGGTLLSLRHSCELRDWAAQRGLALHLDGARLFHAACALEVEPATLAQCTDTLTVSFNKALGAPAGAAVAAAAELIERARRFRWMLGGAWKQGGILAAACEAALDTFPDRIAEDHRLARELAVALNTIPGVQVDLERVVTNMVHMRVIDQDVDLAGLHSELQAHGVGIGRFKEGRVSRLVTHRDISPDSLPRFLELLNRLMSSARCGGGKPSGGACRV